MIRFQQLIGGMMCMCSTPNMTRHCCCLRFVCALNVVIQMGGEEGAVVATQCADPELDDSSESAAQVSRVSNEGVSVF